RVLSDLTGARGELSAFDPLQRFVEAQDGVYSQALAELREGRKVSHWMWFVFPQVAGLGRSSTASSTRSAGAKRRRPTRATLCSERGWANAPRRCSAGPAGAAPRRSSAQSTRSSSGAR